MAVFRAVVLMAGFLGLSLLAMPVQVLVLAVRRPAWHVLPTFYFRCLCRLFGIRVRVDGALAREGPVLLVANHTSYLDIVAMGAVAPVAFVAKKQVRDWPLFGLLARLDRAVFVDRDNRGQAAADIDAIQRRLGEGDPLVLFPEGTSNDGNRVLPFKSALLGAVHPTRPALERGDPPIRVQPVSIAYTRLHGLPMGRQYRPYFAWYGDMDLLPHLWDVFRKGPFDVEIAFHEPVTLPEFKTRKRLAAHCHEVISDSLAASLSGRRGEARPIGEVTGAREAAPAAVPSGAVPSGAEPAVGA